MVPFGNCLNELAAALVRIGPCGSTENVSRGLSRTEVVWRAEVKGIAAEEIEEVNETATCALVKGTMAMAAVVGIGLDAEPSSMTKR